MTRWLQPWWPFPQVFDNSLKLLLALSEVTEQTSRVYSPQTLMIFIWHPIRPNYNPNSISPQLHLQLQSNSAQTSLLRTSQHGYFSLTNMSTSRFSFSLLVISKLYKQNLHLASRCLDVHYVASASTYYCSASRHWQMNLLVLLSAWVSIHFHFSMTQQVSNIVIVNFSLHFSE